jgi:hypothetical protein
MKGFKSTGRGPKSGFRFPSGDGFSGSTGKTQNISYTRRTPQRKASVQKASGGFVPARNHSPPVTKAPMGRPAVVAPRPAPPGRRVSLPVRTGAIGRYAEGGPVFKPPKSGGGRPYKQHAAIRQSFAEDAANRTANRMRSPTPVVRTDPTVASSPRFGGSIGLISQRKREAMGLKKGGNPNRIKNLGKYAHGGKVTGNALTLRTEPTTELDRVSGGRSPLRPGYKRGGKMAAKC